MISGLQQRPVIQAKVPSLISFWNSGFAASRAIMTYVVERGMSSEDFLAVAKSQAPLFELVRAELSTFSNVGWEALSGAHVGRGLSFEDQQRLALFRHDVAQLEGFFPSMVKLAEANENRLKSWYGHAQFLYRKRLAVEQLLRGICYIYHQEASEKGIRVTSNVELERCFSVDCFDAAKMAFKNLISNGIKYGKDGGSLKIWNEGRHLFFKDDGIGMHRNFWARLGRGRQLREKRTDAPGEGLGWLSIGEIARKLGWKWSISSVLNKGTTVRIMLNESNFAPTVSAWVEAHIQESQMDPVGAEKIIEGSRFFAGACPFEGYECKKDGWYWVSQSPIFRAVEQARNLMTLI